MNWLRRFFYGRNGIDALNIALLVTILALNLLNMVFRYIPLIRNIAVVVLTAMQFAALAALVFRALSRNIAARQRENMAFMTFASKIRRKFDTLKLRGDKTHRFFKCPSCKLTLRVPKGKGKVFITCPQCGERFQKTT
jgi:uncharacterized C2H2 Zn-finger protein